jgi:hypothetical protein
MANETPDIVRDSLIAIRADLALYRENQSYYDGTREEVFTSERIRHDIQATGQSYRINFAATAVDVPAERLEVSGIIAPEESTRDYLNEFWADNQLDVELQDAFTMTGVHGSAYIIAWADDDLPSGVSAYIHSPMSVRVFYDPAKPRKKTHAIHTTTVVGTPDNDLMTGETYLLVVLYTDTLIQQHISSNPLPKNNGGYNPDNIPLRLYDEVPNPYGMIPVFKFRTPSGQSDLEPAKAIQDSISKTFITMMTAIDRAGYPQRYAIADKLDQLHDNFSNLAPDDDLSPLDITRGHKAGPDTQFIYSGKNVSVGTFNVAETSNFLAPIESQLGWLAKITDIPVSYYRESGDTPSGVAYKRSETPLLRKIARLQQRYGQTIEEMLEFALAVRGMKTADVSVEWAPPYIPEEADWWEAQTIKKELGVPNPVLLVEGGYDQQTVDSWREEGYLGLPPNPTREEQPITPEIELGAPTFEA